MNKRIVFLVMLLTTIGLISGCSAEDAQNNSVKISPSELFQGDTVSLEPHLDMATGSVDVTYEGDKENIGLKYEIWKEGTLEFSEFIFSSSGEEPGFEGEISFSLQGINHYDLETSAAMTMTSVIRPENGYSSSSVPVQRFSQEFSHSV